METINQKLREALNEILDRHTCDNVAKMPNGSVKIRQFTQIREDESETATLR